MKIYVAGPMLRDPAQIAWMAALFEGEGYVACPKGRMTRQCKGSPLRIKFKMCDRDVLERFRLYAGVGSVSGPFRPSGLGKKPTFEYRVQGAHAYALLVAFWGWLGQRRQEQVAHAIKTWSALRQTKFGRSITSEQAEQIKTRLAAGRRGIGRELAREFGVTPAMISVIKHGRAWA